MPNYKSAPKSLNNAIRTTKSYFKKPYGEQKIILKTSGKSYETRTLANGSFSVIFQEYEKGPIRFYSEGNSLIKYQHSYPESFDFSKANKLVISDIDDTIMKSFTSTRLKRLSTTLFYSPEKRVKITATDKLYGSFIGTLDAFCYVSKSESNLSKLIGEFILFNKLPIGPLFLTPYLTFPELIRGKKDPQFKFKMIAQILDHMEEKTAILIGDDTQADMDTYTLIVKKYGKRIDKVFIRQTEKERSSKQEEKWRVLTKTGVDAIYFKDSDIIEN